MQELTMWKLQSYNEQEVSLLFDARPPLEPHVLTIQLAPPPPASSSSSTTTTTLNSSVSLREGMLDATLLSE